jgi:hypothetical protein
VRFRSISIIVLWAALAGAEETVRHPFVGVTHIHRTETAPRPVSLHLLKIDLTAPGLSFKLSAPRRGPGTRETVRQTTRDFLEQEHAQLAINAHFFLPFPSAEPDADLVGLAVSAGEVFSAFEEPTQSYALVARAPALNIDAENRAAIVHADPDDPERKRVREPVILHTAVSGSAQIITAGLMTIPVYADEARPEGLLKVGGPGNYSNQRSWYEVPTARTIAGLSADRRTLYLFTVDRAGGSQGLTVTEAAGLLLRDYGVYDALNLDGGGSVTLVEEDAESGKGRFLNVPSDGPRGRAVASSLAIFARRPTPSVP